MQSCVIVSGYVVIVIPPVCIVNGEEDKRLGSVEQIEDVEQEDVEQEDVEQEDVEQEDVEQEDVEQEDCGAREQRAESREQRAESRESVCMQSGVMVGAMEWDASACNTYYPVFVLRKAY